MKKTSIFLCLLFVITIMIGCSENQPRKNTDKTSKSSLNKLIVLNDDGSESKFQYKSDRTYCLVATWCPSSKSFIDFMQEPAIQKEIENKKFVFLLGNEWPQIEKQLNELVEIGEMTDEKAQNSLNYLKEKSGYGLILDPNFIDNLHGEVYLLKNVDALNFESFPSIYIEKGDLFTGYFNWIKENIYIDEEIIQLIEKYLVN